MKKHSLMAHWNDVSRWAWDANLPHYGPLLDRQQVFLLAYERWVNDRELLTVEDGYTLRGGYLPDPVLDHPGTISRYE